jgi:hypothetical protein
MGDHPTVAALRRAMDTETRDHRLDSGVADTAWSDAHATSPRRSGTWLAVAAGLVAAAGVATAVALTAGDDTATPSSGPSACDGNVSTASLPPWARAGFGPDGLHTPHVFGAHGGIVGILFVELRAHQPAGTNNKILWVARDGEGKLHISARLEGSNEKVTRTVDLGPSIVDLPSVGCWRMALTWSGHSDTIAFQYR